MPNIIDDILWLIVIALFVLASGGDVIFKENTKIWQAMCVGFGFMLILVLSLR